MKILIVIYEVDQMRNILFDLGNKVGSFHEH